MFAQATLIALSLSVAWVSERTLSTEAVTYGEEILAPGAPANRAPGTFLSRSPDGKSTVTVESRVDGNGITSGFRRITRLRLSGSAGTGSIELHPGLPGEILWSPDSSQVALSPTWNGQYDLIVMGGGRTRVLEVGRWFREQLDAPRVCEQRDFRSVGAVKWLSHSRLLVAMKQAPFDGCGQPYGTMLFDYDLDRAAVVKIYTVKEAKAAFPGVLGSAFTFASGD